MPADTLRRELADVLIRALIGTALLVQFSACTLPIQELPSDFFEEHPAWNMPELAVTDLTVQPERADAGEMVTLLATVSNIGTGPAQAASLVFSVDGVETGRVAVDALPPGAKAEVPVDYRVQRPGRHLVRAALALDGSVFDGSATNDFRTRPLHVSGAPDPTPELEFDDIDFTAIQLLPGTSVEIPVRVRNPGLVPTGRIPLKFHVDDEPVASGIIETLAPGEGQEFTFPWPEVKAGEHVLTITMDPPQHVAHAKIPESLTWYVLVPDKTLLNKLVQKHRWVPLGPEILSNGWVGRINKLAVHPTVSKTSGMINTLYAGGLGNDMGVAAGTGVWKSGNGGSNWQPVGDKLSTLQIRSIAIAPQHSGVIFAGTPTGIFKSLDGGGTWATFAGSKIVKNVIELSVRHEQTGGLILYAATAQGLFRYAGKPKAVSSTAAEWTRIKTGSVRDIALHPSKNNILYAAVQNDGFYRTDKGTSVTEKTEETAWVKLTKGLPSIASHMLLSIELFEHNPDILVVGVTRPSAGVYFGLYRSDTKGNNWKVVKEYLNGELDGAIYNPYVRFSPKLSLASYKPGAAPAPWIIYFGGVRLYQWIEFPAKKGGGVTAQVSGNGVDMKDLVIDPANPAYYYSVGDQGVFRCKTVPTPKQWEISGKSFGQSGDQCTHRNNQLAVAQIYDFGASASNADLMIAGTQDTGTILFEGKSQWRMIKGGDGLFSLINPHTDLAMYAQHQALKDTVRSPDGGKKWYPAAAGLAKGYGLTYAYITPDPQAKDGVLAVGDGKDLYYSDNGGKKWVPQGLATIVADGGNILRVIVDPANNARILGTMQGQLWYRPAKGKWTKVFSHPRKAWVRSL